MFYTEDSVPVHLYTFWDLILIDPHVLPLGSFKAAEMTISTLVMK